jgi:TatD DNase family protein
MHKIKSGGVIHSFEGDLTYMRNLINHNIYISVCGYSLREEKDLDVIREVPLWRLIVETNSPFCEIKGSHSSFRFIKTFFSRKRKQFMPVEPENCLSLVLRGRNEPCLLVCIVEIVAALKFLSDH